MPVQTALGEKFEIVRRIGVGGMAEVYEARHRGAQGFEKRLAVKVLLPELQNEQQVIDMFVDEAMIASRLEHPNIVAVYDFGEVDGLYYLAMEYIDGWTLRDVQQRLQAAVADFPVALAAKIVSELCRALDYIHHGARPVVHRDVTPQNIFVTRQGVVKLGDFGIAKSEARRSRTESGQIKGKLAYLAPEQVSGEAITARTDIFAAGLVLYELLCGCPFNAAARDVDLISAALQPDADTRPPSAVRQAAAPLDNIVTRALQRHPTLRFPTAGKLAAALQQRLDTLPPARFDDLLVHLQDAPLPPVAHRNAPGRMASARAGDRVARLTMHAPAAPPRTVALPRGAPDAAASEPQPITRAASSGRRGARTALVLGLLGICGSGLGVGLWYRGHSRAAAPKQQPLPTGATLAAGEQPPPKTPMADNRVVRSDAPPAPGAPAGTESGADSPLTTGVRPRQKQRAAGSVVHRSSSVAAARRARQLRRRRAHRARSPSASSATRSLPQEAAAPDPQRAQTLRRRIAAALSAARSRGVYPGDDAQLDGQARAARQATASGGAPAEAAVQRLETYAAGLRIDRRFAERKLARLNGHIRAAALDNAQRRRQEQLAQEILQLIIGARFVDASRKMSEALAHLRRMPAAARSATR